MFPGTFSEILSLKFLSAADISSYNAFKMLLCVIILTVSTAFVMKQPAIRRLTTYKTLRIISVIGELNTPEKLYEEIYLSSYLCSFIFATLSQITTETVLVLAFPLNL